MGCGSSKPLTAEQEVAWEVAAACNAEKDKRVAKRRVLAVAKGKTTELDLVRVLTLTDQLTALPESFGKLTALTKLNLQHNQLTELPESIGQLTVLTTLYLGSNRLSSLPESIGQLTVLTSLGLEFNPMQELPESIGNLTALKTLCQHNGKLGKLPESFGNLTALTRLDLYNNQLAALPESFGNLATLEYLSLHANMLTALPASFVNLRAPKVVTLEGNPLDGRQGPLTKVCEKGFKDIVGYFAQLALLDGPAEAAAAAEKAREGHVRAVDVEVKVESMSSFRGIIKSD